MNNTKDEVYVDQIIEDAKVELNKRRCDGNKILEFFHDVITESQSMILYADDSAKKKIIVELLKTI